MVENLKTLKQRIRTAVNISQIAKAMEMISASKIRKAKEAVADSRPYADKIMSVVARIISHIDTASFPSPYIQGNRASRKLIIAISPDKGLCGALPDTIARQLAKLDRDNVRVITIGKKIERAAVKLDYDLVASFPMGTGLPKYGMIYPILEVVNKQFFGGEVGEVHLLYADFRSMLNHDPVTRRLVPVPVEGGKEEKEEIPYTFEPSMGAVLSELLPYYVEVELFNALINAYTSEQAARMISMQNAKENALEIRDGITLSYNKLRQAKITGEILDITNAQFV